MTQVYHFNSAEKEEVKGLFLQKMPETLRHLLPNGIFDKNQFYVGNIKGDPGKSLVVELTGSKAGLWHDLATGEGGDILHLWAAVKGIDIKHNFPAVISSAQKWLGIRVSSSVATPQLPTAPQIISQATPIEASANTSQTSSAEATKVLSGTWHYLNEDSKPIVTVRRYDRSDGKKSFIPYDVISGEYKAPEMRPLYNLPGIKASQQVVIVEGEKCAQALIDIGICATTAMSGANALIEKTDWSPLFKKDVIIWPDNDEPGEKYADLLVKRLKKERIDSLSMLEAAEDKPFKWDAADAVKEGLDINVLINRKTLIARMVFPIHKARHALHKTTPAADDLIEDRILTPHGLLLLGGAPKVRKSDLLLCWLAHMAAGVPFLGMKPARPLKVLYLQAEIEYDYICERIQQIQIDKSLLPLVEENLSFTPDVDMIMDKDGIKMARRSILRHFPNYDVDIIAVDPLRNFFDNKNDTVSENDNNAMLEFLRRRLGALRDSINRNAGIMLVHHTRKITNGDLEEAKFQAFAGAGSLRGCYTTGILLWQPDENVDEYQMVFELRYGKKTQSKWINKNDQVWQEAEHEQDQLINKSHGQILKAERQRKSDVILEIIMDEARRGRVYTINQFCEKFEDKEGLGSKDTIRDRIDGLTNTGDIKFFRNGSDYGLTDPARTKFGYMCVQDMRLAILDSKGRMTAKTETIYPTHFRSGESGALLPVENPKIWIRHVATSKLWMGHE